jgi:glucan endo-1,3-beta-D-glucosidase
LIVPVDSANPSKAYGTSYNGTISPTVSSIFNFDIPASYAGKTCSLVFLFPEISHLETSSYSFNNKGGLAIAGLVAPATEQTSFSSVPATNGQKASIERVVPGNNYSVLTQKCPAGQRISYTFSSAGGLDVNFFQDYNPSPLGVYVTVC